MSHRHTHNASFDYARLIAVIGIIWFHAHAPGAVIGYAGLAFFLLLLVHLAIPQATQARRQSHRAPPFLRYAAARGQRLLLPWLIASVAYGMLKLIDVSRGAPFAAEFQLSMWLTGPALHLWFLPFAFATCLALWPLGRFLRQHHKNHVTPLAFIFTGLALASLALAQEATLVIPLAQWAYALPIVLFGVALTLVRAGWMQMLGLVTFFVCSALAANWTSGLFEITLASLVLILCRQVPLPASSLSTGAARSALALYLIHPAVLAVMLRSGLVADGTMALALSVTVVSCGLIALWDALAAPRLPTLPRLI
ncbi:MAG: hypothetical protein AAFQ39_03510 [Pseudomonadota bacterium]